MNINQAAVGDISSWDSWQLRWRRRGETSKVIISWFSVREREQSNQDMKILKDGRITLLGPVTQSELQTRSRIQSGGRWLVMEAIWSGGWSASHQVAAAGLGSVTSRVHKFLHQHQLHRIYTILWEEIGTFDTKIPSLRVGFEDLCWPYQVDNLFKPHLSKILNRFFEYHIYIVSIKI